VLSGDLAVVQWDSMVVKGGPMVALKWLDGGSEVA
jgi:hypothetical protein